jgi:UDP-N-acetylglucosamine--N-acetylmuramyl-(pentapeptide) pyrophosphoryl-undecaprenol N-acetylglucosamine transferase
MWQTKQILKNFKPDLVVGTGGYVSGPVVFTAAFFGIPALLHEQNAFPAVTNRILARVVKKIMVTFPESARYFPAGEKVHVVGLPVREEIGKVERRAGAAAFSLDPMKKTLLVTGGSRGALSINKAMIHVLTELAEYQEIQVIWATGTATYAEIIKDLDRSGIRWRRGQWRIIEYIDNMAAALACSDLCICRAGAATLAELSAAGKAGILIPYPYAAENHQEYNARAFADKKAGRLILDKELDGPKLWDAVNKILFNPFLMEQMAARAREAFEPGALDRILTLCRQTAWR